MEDSDDEFVLDAHPLDHKLFKKRARYEEVEDDIDNIQTGGKRDGKIIDLEQGSSEGLKGPLRRKPDEVFDHCGMDKEDQKRRSDKIDEPKLKKTGRPSKPSQSATYEHYHAADIVKFIDLIHGYRCLWDTTDADYHRYDYKNILFNKIETEMSLALKKGRTPGKTAATLWENLRKEWKDADRAHLNAPSGSGTSKVSFPFYAHLDFLETDRIARAVSTYAVYGPRGQNMNKGLEKSTRGTTAEVSTTPKRKVANNGGENVHLRESVFQMTKSLTMYMERKLEPAPAQVACASDSICTLFAEKTRNWTPLEKHDAEHRVYTFVKNLQKEPEMMFENQTLSSLNSAPLSYLYSTPNYNSGPPFP